MSTSMHLPPPHGVSSVEGEDFSVQLTAHVEDAPDNEACGNNDSFHHYRVCLNSVLTMDNKRTILKSGSNRCGNVSIA